MASKKLMTRDEIAAELSVHVNTIDKWRKQGLPVVKQGKIVRFDVDDVIEWIKGDKQ